MSTLILIPCSDKKVQGGAILPITDFFSAQLNVARNQIAQRFDVNFNQPLLMPAYQRYGAGQLWGNGGRLYCRIDWTLAAALVAAGALKILIVSALYGFIEYDTPIADYDLTMNQTITYWRNGGLLQNAFDNYLINNPGITEVRSFLSQDYQKPFNDDLNMNNQWVPYDRVGNTALQYINPLLENL